MRKVIYKSFIISFVLLLLCNCQNKQQAGALTGALLGGVVGAQFGKGSGQLIATGVGAAAGALIGNEIGKNLDEHDKMLMQKSSRRALETAPSGQQIEWKNPDSGNYGYIEPTKTYKNNDGRYCREFTQTIVVAGEQQKAYGTACRQEDGQWQIVSQK